MEILELEQEFNKLKDYTERKIQALEEAGVSAATTAKLGSVKMSVVPVDAASPIAVGDNDTRVPSQSENDALTGTSGTPSSTNEYVTRVDIVYKSKSVAVQIVSDANEVDTSVVYDLPPLPLEFNGKSLVRAQASVKTAGTTNATTIQVRNITKYASNDALSGAISIASGATLGTVGTVDTSYDDVATDDIIRISVTGNSTTKAKGLTVVLTYQ